MPYEYQRSFRFCACSECFGDPQYGHSSRAVIISTIPDPVIRCAGSYSSWCPQSTWRIGILTGFTFSIANVIVMSSERYISILKLRIGAFDYSNYIVRILCANDLVLCIDIERYADVLESESW